jgi:membrane protease YdiL (CAAX protease family)
VEEQPDAEIPSGESPATESHDSTRLIERIFRNRFAHVRAIWRLLTYSIAAYLIGIGINAMLGLIVPDSMEAEGSRSRILLIMVTINLGLLLGGLVVLRWVDRRPTALLGLDFSRGWLRESVIGLAAGLAATGFLVLILVVTASVTLAPAEDLPASLGALPFYFCLFTLAAAAEEFVFRGYPLQAVAEGSRRWIAGVLLSLPFTFGHASNPDVTLIGVANIFLASLVLVILYFQTRRLWLPITFHLSWNLTQSWLWGFDVSGIKIENQLFEMTSTGSDLVTGGEFGLEGSILSTLFFAALMVWFLVRPILHPTAEVAALWAQYPAGFGLEPAQPPDAGCSMPDTRSAHPPDFHAESGPCEEEKSSIEDRESSI